MTASNPMTPAAPGVPASVILSRLRLGWPPERAGAVPVRRYRKGDEPPPLRKHRATGRARASWQAGGRRLWAYLGKWGDPSAEAAYKLFAERWRAGIRPDAR